MSCRTEAQPVMELEGTSSRCLHLSHPLTSLNEKWMGALRKLVRRSLTSVFPVPTVFSGKTMCVCVCVSGWWAVWIGIKLEKGSSRSLTGGPAAIAALLALQSQGVVTNQGQRLSRVPSKRVNDGPLPPRPRLAVAWLEGTELIRCSFFISTVGRKVSLWVRFKMMNSAVCEDKVWLVYELRVVQLWSVVSTSISLWVCVRILSLPPFPPLSRQARRTPLISVLVQSSKTWSI